MTKVVRRSKHRHVGFSPSMARNAIRAGRLVGNWIGRKWHSWKVQKHHQKGHGHRRSVFARVPGTGGHYSKSVNLVGRRNKFVKKVGAALGSKVSLTQNSSGRMTSNIGQQSASTIGYQFGGVDLNTLLGKYSAVGTKLQSMFLDKATSRISLINQDPGNVEIVIYDLIARQSASGLQSLGVDPQSLWSVGASDEGGNNICPYQTPFVSKLFTEQWKIKKATKIILGTGQCHVHYSISKPNRRLNREEMRLMDTNVADASLVRGLTTCQMIVLLGSIANDSVTKTQVSYAAAAVDFVYSVTYDTHGLGGTPQVSYSISNNLPQSFTVSGEIMDNASGLIVAEVPANQA